MMSEAQESNTISAAPIPPEGGYEAVLVYDPAVDDQGLETELEKVKSTVESHGGSITNRDVWGKRSLAYPIAKKEQGVYAVLNFDGDNALVSELNRQLRINDLVLRSLVVKKDKFAPDSPTKGSVLQSPNRGDRGDRSSYRRDDRGGRDSRDSRSSRESSRETSSSAAAPAAEEKKPAAAVESAAAPASADKPASAE